MNLSLYLARFGSPVGFSVFLPIVPRTLRLWQVQCLFSLQRMGIIHEDSLDAVGECSRESKMARNPLVMEVRMGGSSIDWWIVWQATFDCRRVRFWLFSIYIVSSHQIRKKWNTEALNTSPRLPVKVPRAPSTARIYCAVQRFPEINDHFRNLNWR